MVIIFYRLAHSKPKLMPICQNAMYVYMRRLFKCRKRAMITKCLMKEGRNKKTKKPQKKNQKSSKSHDSNRSVHELLFSVYLYELNSLERCHRR